MKIGMMYPRVGYTGNLDSAMSLGAGERSNSYAIEALPSMAVR